MNVSIDPELRKKIEEKVTSGRYATPEDVLHAGLAALEQQESFGDFGPGELDALIAEAEQSIRDQGTLDGDQALQERRQRRGRPETQE